MNLILELQRKIYFLNWWSEEVMGRKATSDIYDSVSRHNKYETAVHYADRVMRLTKIYKYIPIQPNDILDLACGTGANIDALPWKKNTRILGIDISEGMLTQARRRFSAYPNIRFVKRNLFTMATTVKQYDLITMTYATRFVPKEKEQDFVNLICKLLRPGGYFITVVTEERLPVAVGRFLTFIDVPRGYNARMNYSGYLIKLFVKSTRLIQKLYIKSYPLSYIRQTALIFQK